jgi:hypothetical protein
MIMIMNMKKMNPTVTILGCVLAAGLASAQNPTIIQSTRNTMNGVSNNSTAASNEALGIQQAAPSSSSSSSSSSSTASVGVKAAVKPASAKPASAKSSAGIAIVPAATAPAKTSAVKIVPVSGVKPVAVGVVKVDAVKTENVKHHAQPKAILVGVKAPSASSTTPIATAAPEDDKAGSDQAVVPDGKYAANGRRDPFISPVVSHAGGSGCSTGKKCLEIGAINLRGVVHGENGFIAVVSNSLNKAYFLRENDPVFNGYVVKITGDSVVFQETLQDRMGKTFTREVVKKITTPAV